MTDRIREKVIGNRLTRWLFHSNDCVEIRIIRG